MVFIYEVTDRLIGLWKEIYKIHNDDSISKLAKIETETFREDNARIAVDNDGNYIIHELQGGIIQLPNINKIDRIGNVLWPDTVPKEN